MSEEIGHICGRFHPFHRQHLDYAKWTAENSDKLIIGITNADPLHTEKEEKESKRHKEIHNPFTYAERHQMIRRAIRNSDISVETQIMPFPINKPELWDNYAPKNVTHYIKVAEEWQNEKANRLKKAGRNVKTSQRNREVSGTEIREKIAKNQDWERDLPKPVAAYIKERELQKKVKSLYRQSENEVK